MRALILFLALAATTAQADSYFVKHNGAVIHIPFSHEVIIQPKGFNSKAFSFKDNLEGMTIDADGRQKWPLLVALCAIYGPIGYEDGELVAGPTRKTNACLFKGLKP